MHRARLALICAVICATISLAIYSALIVAPHIQANSLSSTAQLACGRWNVVSSPNPGAEQDSLNGIAAVSANNVWAVGGSSNQLSGVGNTLVEHWNGSVWSATPSPNVNAGGVFDSLSAVTALSASDVWAVGAYYDYNNRYLQTLIEHWDGVNWSVVSSSSVLQAGGELSGISAAATNDIWAVGYYEDPTTYNGQALIEHWDGASWRIVPSPSVTSNTELTAVAAISSNNVWAVGYNTDAYDNQVIEHWDGTTWSILPGTISGQLSSIVATSANNIWVAGKVYNSSGYTPLLEHFDGNTWNAVPSASQGTTVLNTITATPGTDALWAAGTHVASSGNDITFVEQLRNNTWSLSASANTTSTVNQLYGLVALGAYNVWAVGQYNPATTTTATRATLRSKRQAGNGPYSGISPSHTLILHYSPQFGIACHS